MSLTIKKSILAAALALPLVASAQNLLSNGSFESGLAGWTPGIVPAASANPVAINTYLVASPTTFGELVAFDNAVSLSPNAVGTQFAMFSKDDGLVTLSQVFTVTSAGLYRVGFSAYATVNGYSNTFAANYGAQIDSTSVITGTVGALAQTTWTAQTGTINLAPGIHTFTFTFAGTGITAKDLAVDRIYVTAVPEPGTYALMAAGIAAMGFVARRRRVG